LVWLEQALVLEQELGQGWVPGQGLEPVPVPVPVPALGQEQVPALGLHKQLGSQLVSVPTELTIFSFSSEKSLHLDFGRLKYSTIESNHPL